MICVYVRMDALGCAFQEKKLQESKHCNVSAYSQFMYEWCEFVSKFRGMFSVPSLKCQTTIS